MANKTATLYLASKLSSGKWTFSALPRKPIDLTEPNYYRLFWYEQNKRKSKEAGRFYDAARSAQIRKESELKRTALGEEVEAEPETRSRDLNAFATAYLKEASHKSRKTHLAYTLTLQAFLKVATHTTLETLTRQDVIDFLDSMAEAGLEKRTIANRTAYLRTFFLYYELKWPLKKTDRTGRFDYTEKTVYAYSKEELRKLFAATAQDETDIFQFLLCTGAREKEAIYATWRDIDFNGRRFRVREKSGFTPKDKEEGSIPIPAYLVEMLMARRERCPDSKLIFGRRDGAPEGHLLRILKLVAFENDLNCCECENKNGDSCKDKPVCGEWGLHRFRKTFATMHHAQGVPARTIQKWLRHSSLETTLRYLADVEDQGTSERVESTFACLQPPMKVRKKAA